MGGQQSYGQAISTFNEKKAVIIGQVNVQTSADHMTEIIVALGNTIHPQLWNVGLMEIRSMDTDFPLNYRRFCMSDPQNEYQEQFIPEKIIQFESTQRPQQKQFHDRSGQFWTILIPSFVLEQQQNEESFIQEQRVYPLCEKMKQNAFREQYQQAYIGVFKSIEEQMDSQQPYISVGILDMKPNNPILGIDNYTMTQDIIEAFMQCSPKIHKLIFISEIETQAFIMGIALKDKSLRFQDITQRFVEQDKQKEAQEIKFNLITLNIEQEIQFKQEEDIQLNSNNIQQEPSNLIQKIQKPNVVSYHNGHKQNIAYSYFREFNVPLNKQVFQTIIPIMGHECNQLCLCGRNLIIRTDGNLCCYCGLQRSTIFQCEQRACGRQYCVSCFNPTKFYNLCLKGHSMKYFNQINNQLECSYCRQFTYRCGYFLCTPCQFKICALCYYSKYAEWQLKKVKIYLNCLRKTQPNLRQEVYYQIITEYLLDANLTKLQIS